MSRSILFLHSSSDLYGADRSLLRTINAVNNQNTRITVCLPYDGPLVSAIKDIGGEVVIMNLAVLRRKYFTPWGIAGFVLAFLIATLRLAILCSKLQVDIIHSNTTAILVGGVVSKLTRRIHLWHVREIIIDPAVIRKTVAWFVANFSTCVICVSEATKSHLISCQSEIASIALVINNGIDPDFYTKGDGEAIRSQYEISESDVLIGMIARVSNWKGQGLFTDMASIVTKTEAKARFMAIGSPFQGQEKLMQDFKDRVEKVGLKEKLTIVQFTEDVNSYLNAFDIFVLPSTLPDPFPTTVLEAMAASRTIVVNGHGGAVDMILHGDSGVIIHEINNAESFAHAITDLLGDPHKRQSLGQAASERLQSKFTEEIYAKNISNLFDRYKEAS